jgi:hypothetical protein
MIRKKLILRELTDTVVNRLGFSFYRPGWEAGMRSSHHF